MGSDRVSDPLGETVEIWQAFADLEYVFYPDWSASLTLTYLDIFQKVPGSNYRDRERGIGDSVFLFHWAALDTYRAPPEPPEGEDSAAFSWLQEPTYRLVWDFGTTIPTGDPREPQPNPGGTPLSSLQTGTGTWNPVIGGQFRVDWGGIAATIGGNGVIPVYENRYDFKAGAYQKYYVAMDLGLRPNLRLALGFEFEHTTRDEIDGKKLPKGGGWRYLLHPQAVWTVSDRVCLFFGASVPVYRKFDTEQVDSDVRWELGLQVNF